MVGPDDVWYQGNLNQNYAFDDRHKAFAAWVAKHDATYGLGTDPAGVEAAWYRMRAAVAAQPAGGKVGASELEDTFLPGGYYNGYWPYLAEAFAAYVNDGDTEALVTAYDNFGATGPAATTATPSTPPSSAATRAGPGTGRPGATTHAGSTTRRPS